MATTIPPTDPETLKTILLLSILGFLALLLMVLRLAFRKYRRQKFNRSDYLTMAAIVCLLGRTALTIVVVLWGNNNLPRGWYDPVEEGGHVWEEGEVYRRGVGSVCTIVNRLVYNTYIWIQKSVVLLLYHQFLSGLPFPRQIMRIYWFVLLLTYLVSQAATFIECRPVGLYWQVVPDPGTCPSAPLQLIIFISLNIFTDILLIALPMPWLVNLKRTLKERLQLILLFSIGFFVVAIAIIRLPINWGNGTGQINRNTWGSVEAFAAAFVANVPTLFALRKNKRRSSSPVRFDRVCACGRMLEREVEGRGRKKNAEGKGEGNVVHLERKVTRCAKCVEEGAAAGHRQPPSPAHLRAENNDRAFTTTTAKFSRKGSRTWMGGYGYMDLDEEEERLAGAAGRGREGIVVTRSVDMEMEERRSGASRGSEGAGGGVTQPQSFG